MVKIIVTTFFALAGCVAAQYSIDLQRFVPSKSPLRLSGYYVSKGWIYFLYQNGCFYFPGSYSAKYNPLNIKLVNQDLSDLKTFYEGSGDARQKMIKDPIHWGVVRIVGDSITTEKGEASSGGPLKTVVRYGRILNDTTFVMTKTYNNYSKKMRTLVDTFRFVHYLPKPDSTNFVIDKFNR